MREHLTSAFASNPGSQLQPSCQARSPPRALARRVLSRATRRQATGSRTRQPTADLDRIGAGDGDHQALRRQSVKELLADAIFEGRSCRKAGVVVGSVIDPRSATCASARNEGRLFHRAGRSLGRLRHHLHRVVEKTLGADARKAIDRPPGQIAKEIAGMGRALGGPWRSEEKSAATAAWMVL
jgi:hypothetical protein